MEKSYPEPEWWRSNPREIITLIKTESNCWSHWPVKLKHNGKEYLIPRDWLNIHINGWAVYIKWVDVTKKIQKWVENVFRHNAWNGKIESITIE